MNIIGQKIVKVRWMTKKEREKEGWYEDKIPAIELDNGAVIYPGRDDEGNGGGSLFGYDNYGDFYITP